MDELAQLLEEAELEKQAHTRFSETDSYQAVLRTQARRAHHFYAPLNGDQWPEDASLRPGKIHMSVNIVKPAVNIDARLQAILPRIVLTPDGLSPEQRVRAESAEKLHLAWLEASGWEVWMQTLCRTRSLYRKGVIKVFWNKEDKRPDARVVEQPTNLRIGWGSNDFSTMDWALYESEISPLEAMRRFEIMGIGISDDRQHLTIQQGTDHSDPLGQGGDTYTSTSVLPRNETFQPSGYDLKHVRLWDYWYKKIDSQGQVTVCNAQFVEGILVKPRGAKSRVQMHKYMPDIPYIVVENDHEPGTPEGMSYVEDIIDLQVELNRALAHWAQFVADEVDPAWQLTGENADDVPPGIVPKAGQITPAGAGNKIETIAKSLNTFPVSELISSIWDHYHKITGLSGILFGEVPGAQTSGRAVAIQVEAAANRLEPKRKLLYQGLRELLIFWTYMAEKVNPKIQVGTDEQGNAQMAGLKVLVGGFRRWKIIAPEITPRDVIENTQNEINKVQARVSSRKTSMDALGIDSPEDEIKLIKEEQTDMFLNPEAVQAIVAIQNMAQQMQMTQAQMQQQLAQMSGGQPGQPGQPGQQGVGAEQQMQQGAAAIQQQQYAAQPTGFEDQNQPMTQAGSAPPAGGQGPQQQTLIRDGRALNQIAIR